MSSDTPILTRPSTSGDVPLMESRMSMFGKACDDPAIALYSKLRTREDVLHFDIAPDPKIEP